MAKPITIFISSRDRPLYLWACLDALYRCTKAPHRFILVDMASNDPLVERVTTGFERRGMFDKIIRMPRNDAALLADYIFRSLTELSPFFAYIESDVVVERTDPCWLSQMSLLMEGRPSLAMLGSAIDPSDFVVSEAFKELRDDLDEAHWRALIKADSPERFQNAEDAKGEALFRPHHPAGRLLLLKTEAVAKTGLGSDRELDGKFRALGYETAIAAKVRHRHLSLLQAFDYHDYSLAARDKYMDFSYDAPANASGPRESYQFNSGLANQRSIGGGETPPLRATPGDRPFRPSSPDARKIVVVLGMHRSGTSLCAHILNALGVAMAEKADADEGNPKGHWERPEIVALHDEILKTIGRDFYSVDHDLPFPNGWWTDPEIRAIRDQLALHVGGALKGGMLFGFKDPRTARLLPVWREIFEELKLEPRFVVCVRHPSFVAESLARRDGFSEETGEYRWLTYMVDCFRFTMGDELCLIHYDEWFESPLVNLEKLVNFLHCGMTLDRAEGESILGTIVDPKLRRSTGASKQASGPLAQTLFNLCCAPRLDVSIRRRINAFAYEFSLVQDYMKIFERPLVHRRELLTESEKNKAQCESLAAKSTRLEKELDERDVRRAKQRSVVKDLKDALWAGGKAANKAADSLRLLSSPETGPDQSDGGSVVNDAPDEDTARHAENRQKEIDERPAPPRSVMLEESSSFEREITSPLWSSLSEARKAVEEAGKKIAIGLTLADSLDDHKDLDEAERQIRSSGLFDEQWYNTQCSENESAGSAIQHYLERGCRLGYSPNPYFDSEWYLAVNEDVRLAGMNPLIHYIRYGATEGRDAGPQFRTAEYVDNHPEVRASGENPLTHFLRSTKGAAR